MLLATVPNCALHGGSRGPMQEPTIDDGTMPKRWANDEVQQAGCGLAGRDAFLDLSFDRIGSAATPC